MSILKGTSVVKKVNFEKHLKFEVHMTAALHLQEAKVDINQTSNDATQKEPCCSTSSGPDKAC